MHGARCSGSCRGRRSAHLPRQSFVSWILLGVLSCSSLRKVGECKQMVDTVNGGLNRIAILEADAGASPITYAQLANEYEALARGLETTSSSDEALNKTIGAYRELMQRSATLSRQFSEELDRPVSTPEEEREKDTRLARLRAQAKNEVNREASLVRKLNGLCHTQ